MSSASSRTYFENAAGRLSEQPTGGSGYVLVEHHPGPRRLSDLQTLLGHAKQLLARRGWHKMLGDQRHMVPFTVDEQDWVTTCWLNVSRQSTGAWFGAVVLPAEMYAQLPADVAETPGQAAAMTYRLFDDPDQARAWLTGLR